MDTAHGMNRYELAFINRYISKTYETIKIHKKTYKNACIFYVAERAKTRQIH